MNNVVLTAPSQPSTDIDFRAVVLSSGQQMHITFGGQGGEEREVCRYLAGAQRNRKTVSREFLIHGLKLPRVFKTRLPRSDNDCDADQRTVIPDWGPWGEAAVRSHLNKANPDIRTLKHFWKAATKLTVGYEFALTSNWRNIFHSRVADWLLPPNSRHYFISTDRYSDHIYCRHYLMLMIKRGSRYWDCLWEDIIREAKEELVKVDNAEDFQRLDEDSHEIVRTPRSVGAANPSVILTVGLEVRLFQWRQRKALPDDHHHYDGILTETEPGKVLSILNVEDREAIEVVLRAAVQRLQDAPKKGSAYWIKRP